MEKACLLGTDRNLRERVSAKIEARQERIWGDMQTVYEWAAFLSTAVERRPPTPKKLLWFPAGAHDQQQLDTPMYFHSELPRMAGQEGTGFE